MKIEITQGRTPVSDFFAKPLSTEGEAELLNLQFGDALLALMKEQGISRVELARRMGIQPSRVTAMLSGTGNFTTATMIRAARAVGSKYHHCLAPASHSVRWSSWETSQVHPAFHARPAVKRTAEVTFFNLSALPMTTPAQPLRASPLQIERYEFLDVEVHAAKELDAHTDLHLGVKRDSAQHNDDPYHWRVELTVDFGREKDGKPSIYMGRIRVAGYFRVHATYPLEKVRDLVEMSGAAILYGACREMLATVTARGPQGMLSLPSISFGTPEKTEAQPAKEGGVNQSGKSGAPRRRVRK